MDDFHEESGRSTDYEDGADEFDELGHGALRSSQSRGYRGRTSESAEGLPILYNSSSPRGSGSGSPKGRGSVDSSSRGLSHTGSRLHQQGSGMLSSESSLPRAAGDKRASVDSFSPPAVDKGTTKRVSEYNIIEPDKSYEKLPKLNELAIQEIMGLLKVKTSMLALGACERVKQHAQAHPEDVINTPILIELINIVKDGPGTPLAGAAMSALASLALLPEGRQKICIQGGSGPLIKLVARADVTKPNTDRAVGLLMNLAADQQNRRVIRNEGGIEALVTVLNAAGMNEVMEHAMGALHNTMLADSKSKVRAVEAGILGPLLKVIHSNKDESSMLVMRAKLLMGELVKVPGLDAKLSDEAAAYSN